MGKKRGKLSVPRSRRSARPKPPTKPRRTRRDGEPEPPPATDSRATDDEPPPVAMPAIPVPPTVLTLLARFTSGAIDDPEVLAGWLRFWDARYREGGNPAFALEGVAQMLVQLANEDRFPSAIRSYAVRIATNIQALSRTNIPTDRIAPAITEALEFSPARGENPFRVLTDAAHDLSIAFAVWKRIGMGEKLDFALDTVAREHAQQCARTPRCESLSRSTVGRIWHAHKLHVVPPHLQRSDEH